MINIASKLLGLSLT